MSRRLATPIARGAVRRSTRRMSPAIAMTDLPKPETKVFKFGGSSVGSAQALRNVGNVLCTERDNGNSVVSVLSAMFGVTNKLVEATERAAAHDMSAVRRNREILYNLHKYTADELLSADAKAEKADIMDYVTRILTNYYDAVCEEIAEKKGADAYDVDRVSSLGERLSSKVMASYLDSLEGVESGFFESDQLIVTDDVSGGATPKLKETREKVNQLLMPLLNRQALPIVTGFFGATEDGKITTLGRGGSDLSATVLGHAIDADEVSLFKVEYTTDSEGWLNEWQGGWVGVVHDADPEQTIPALAYEEAAELAHFGKKVLHPETVRPAIEKSIPICVKNTYDPSHNGTRICELSDLDTDAIVVAAITKLEVDAYEKKHGCSLDTGAIPKEESSIVALVGANLLTWNSLADEVEAAMKAADIPCHIPSRVNGSSNNFSVVVPTTMKKEAVKALHAAFIDDSVLDESEFPKMRVFLQEREAAAQQQE